MLWPFQKKQPAYDEEETNLGEVLMKMGFVTEQQLLEAAKMQTRMPDRRIGEILVCRGALSPEDLSKALDVQEKLRTGREAAANLAIARCHIERSRTKTRELQAVSLKLAHLGGEG